MSEPPSRRAFAAASLDELDRVLTAGGVWRPVRRALDVTAFGVNAYTADHAGDALIEAHDETSAGAGGHEELYVVVGGHAAFTVDGEAVDAPAGTLLRIDRGTPRQAVAAARATTVLVIGGVPGAAMPSSPFEHWYAAQPAYDRGDYRQAVEIASEGLADWPEHGTLHYQLACFEALDGHPDDAVRHLAIAFEQDPRTREWAATDADLDSVREHPGYPA